MKNKTAIVAKLIEHGKQYYQPDAARVPQEVLSDPFAFLIGAAFNNGMCHQQAWKIPLCIKREGLLDAAKLAAMEEQELQRLLESLSIKPRWGYERGVKTLKDAAMLVMAHGGDASAIWRNSSSQETVRKLQCIYGVGKHIASMIVRILRDNLGMFSEQKHEIDVKSDVHLMRVFKRAGLTETVSDVAAVNAARELHPEFPGALDWPAWNIGRKWCYSDGPNCTQCPLDAVCEKAI
ncbi:MAG: hypothetical protein F4Y39_16085 [Gemmatimonadetes bacterium]|nr:hypothetical protein [Gemmatimonadota bacterium]MYF72461.1 hypothetical protein [Gemmatimonadota bacterium]MYK51211.1 hypothetical protein [Gemmatimonadota bacterium]